VSGDRLKLEVREREDLGSRRTRRLRSQGLIPGVLYGKGHTRPIVVPERELRAAMTGASGLHAILDVVIEGQTTVHPSILADYQQDPLRGTISHIDLREVRLDQPIHATVSLHLVGEAVGATEGGVLTQTVTELNVEALPLEVPASVEFDVSGLQIGESAHLSQVSLPDGVTLLDDGDSVFASVTLPTRFEEPEPEEAAEGELAEGEEPGEGEAAAAEGEEPAADESPEE